MLALLSMTPSTTWNPDSYAKNARFVSDLGAPLLELLAPKSDELILDLGCGDGALTEKIAAGGAAVLGIDGSLHNCKPRAAAALWWPPWTGSGSRSYRSSTPFSPTPRCTG